jgi:hypothetical protein
MFRNILMPIDGSPEADRSSRSAESTNATLTVMTWSLTRPPGCWPAPPTAPPSTSKPSATPENEHQQLLDLATTSILAPISVTKVLAHGKPGHQYSNR